MAKKDQDQVESTAPATEASDTETKQNKSIVPSKYGNKYRNGGSDDLAKFINDQCTGKDGFEYSAFFTLCHKNGLPAEKVDHYKAQVDEKKHGANGRARMTLRNMLATVARKEGGLVDLAGNKHVIDVPKPATSGAAAKAKENAEVAAGSETNEASA